MRRCDTVSCNVGSEIKKCKHVEKVRMAVTELLKYALIIVSTVPLLIVYPFIQKNFVKGVMVGAVKG